MENLIILVMRTNDLQKALDNADEFGYDISEQYQVEGALDLDTGASLIPCNGYIQPELRTEAGINKALNRIHTDFEGKFDIRKDEVNPFSCEDMSVTNICSTCNPKDNLVVVFVSAYYED